MSLFRVKGRFPNGLLFISNSVSLTNIIVTVTSAENKLPLSRNSSLSLPAYRLIQPNDSSFCFTSLVVILELSFNSLNCLSLRIRISAKADKQNPNKKTIGLESLFGLSVYPLRAKSETAQIQITKKYFTITSQVEGHLKFVRM